MKSENQNEIVEKQAHELEEIIFLKSEMYFVTQLNIAFMLFRCPGWKSQSVIYSTGKIPWGWENHFLL